MDDREHERLAGWVLAFLGVLAVAVGVGWWFAAAPAPVPPPAAQSEVPVAEPEPPEADYEMLQRVGVQIPVLGDNVVYDVTMLGPGDWRSYEVPGPGESYEIQLVCRGGDDVLVSLAGENEFGVACDGVVLIGEIAPGTVTVRRAGNAPGAMAIRVSPVP